MEFEHNIFSVGKPKQRRSETQNFRTTENRTAALFCLAPLGGARKTIIVNTNQQLHNEHFMEKIA